MLGCATQRCTAHFLRDCLRHARRDQQPMLAALIRPLLNAQGRAEARERLGEDVSALAQAAGGGGDACGAEDVLAFYASPPDHWLTLRSTNPLELQAA